jgi:integrase
MPFGSPGRRSNPLTVAQGRRNAARWTVAVGLGLRQGEALGLAWQSVDLDEDTLIVRQALQRQAGGGLVLIPPKSEAGRRTIAVPAQLVGALRAQRAAGLAERLAAGTAPPSAGSVLGRSRRIPACGRSSGLPCLVWPASWSAGLGVRGRWGRLRRW